MREEANDSEEGMGTVREAGSDGNKGRMEQLRELVTKERKY